MDWFISPCNSIHLCLTNFDSVVRSIPIKHCYGFLGNRPFYHYVCPLFIPDYFLCPVLQQEGPSSPSADSPLKTLHRLWKGPAAPLCEVVLDDLLLPAEEQPETVPKCLELLSASWAFSVSTSSRSMALALVHRLRGETLHSSSDLLAFCSLVTESKLFPHSVGNF